MAIIPGGRAPYAEPGNIRRAIQAYRKGELPTPLSPELLMRARVGANAVAETLESLKLLGLVDEDGQPTPAFETLRSASESEFQMRLGEVVRVAYDDLFRNVDPIKDSPTRVLAAFRAYEPQARADRMYSLFIALCRAGGIRRNDMSEPIVLTKEQARRYLQLVKLESERKHATSSRERASEAHGTRDSLPPALLGLLSSIPPEQIGWTQERRDQFYAAFGSVLDYCIPIRAAGDDEEDERKSVAS